MKKNSSYLFLDTTSHLTLGLLTDNFSWLDYRFIQHQKSSQVIHHNIFEMLESNKLSMDDVTAVFQVSGPGSYTGMRVGEGIAQILEWQNKQVYSFYHFEVPALLKVKKGQWISKAFKGEYFIYNWNSSQNRTELVSQDNFLFNKSDDTYTHFAGEIESVNEFKLTSKLIFENASKLFPEIFNKKSRKELFYYRTLEKEFSKKV